MLTAIKGYYEKGKIVLRKMHRNRIDVIGTFLTDENMITDKKRIPGGLAGRVSLPDNFDEPMQDMNNYM